MSAKNVPLSGKPTPYKVLDLIGGGSMVFQTEEDYERYIESIRKLDGAFSGVRTRRRFAS